jgi:type I restriction enzyme M protein
VLNRLKAKKVLVSYAKAWSQIDLKPFNHSEITTLEEHIKWPCFRVLPQFV